MLVSSAVCSVFAFCLVFFARNAKLLVKRLLTPDLTKRYGNLKNGVADIKEHKWFAGFDWNALLKKSLPPPYKPVFKVRKHGVKGLEGAG